MKVNDKLFPLTYFLNLFAISNQDRTIYTPPKLPFP
jgi:hypothetical protein